MKPLKEPYFWLGMVIILTSFLSIGTVYWPVFMGLYLMTLYVDRATYAARWSEQRRKEKVNGK